MEEHKEGTNSRHILVLATVFMCLFMAGNASATTFPVDEAGISAYVKVSDSIDLETVMENLLPHIAEVLKVNPTYFIVTVTNDDGQNTHLYVGADGWVISYYLGTEEVSRAVRWNIASEEDPTPEEVTSMTTLEEVISKTCDAAGIDYETIKSGIKFYDFEHPNADRMMFAVDMQSGVDGWGSNSFYMAIPSEVIVKESSYSHYHHGVSNYRTSSICVNGASISSVSGDSEHAYYNNCDLTPVQKNTIRFSAEQSVLASGVGWVVVYET